jgi:hypothetical protein
MTRPAITQVGDGWRNIATSLIDPYRRLPVCCAPPTLSACKHISPVSLWP